MDLASSSSAKRKEEDKDAAIGGHGTMRLNGPRVSTTPPPWAESTHLKRSGISGRPRQTPAGVPTALESRQWAGPGPGSGPEDNSRGSW
ncbi:hypothetical protein MRX96_013970 [Rhipicephalus microplus]